MPSGARTMEHGRPVMCGIIQSPMASKYSARSNLVTGFLSPASGQSGLSGLEMVTPRTVLGPFAVAAAAVAPPPLDLASMAVPERLALGDPALLTGLPALAELPTLAELPASAELLALADLALLADPPSLVDLPPLAAVPFLPAALALLRPTDLLLALVDGWGAALLDALPVTEDALAADLFAEDLATRPPVTASPEPRDVFARVAA